MIILYLTEMATCVSAILQTVNLRLGIFKHICDKHYAKMYIGAPFTCHGHSLKKKLKNLRTVSAQTQDSPRFSAGNDVSHSLRFQS